MRQQTSDGPIISAQTLHENKTKWRVAPKRKIGAAAKHWLKQTADCRAPQSQIDWTIEPLNQKSQIAQEYGLLPADARQQQNISWKLHRQKNSHDVKADILVFQINPVGVELFSK